MIHKRDRFASSILLVTTLPVLLNMGCGPSKYNFFTEYPLPCAVVREANFRCGPVDLPVTAESWSKISTFLQRGGDWNNQDLVDRKALKRYEGLFELLSDAKFLRSGNFRNEETIDQVSAQLKPWFDSPIIYQLVDATQEQPLAPAPICAHDGKYWWIFYTGRRLADTGDLEITKVLISAPLARTIEHHPELKKTAADACGTDSAGQGPAQILADAKTGPQNPQDMHAALLRQFVKVADVQLVARLKDERLGHPAVHGVRVFIPDVHLLSKEREKKFDYVTNHVDVLTDVVGELITFKQSATGRGVPVTVYQLGDFVDLWRQFPKYMSIEKAAEQGEMNYQKVLEDHLTLSRRLLGPELGTRMVLGNHDFNTHYVASCIGSSLVYLFPYDPASGPVAAVIHGDYLDPIQRKLSERLQHRATYRFAPSVKEVVYDLGGMSAKIMGGYGPDPIGLAKPGSLGKSAHVSESTLLKDKLAQSRFNVQAAGDPEVPERVFGLFSRAEYYAGIVNDLMGWNLRFAVIGHTHMARIVLDERSAADGGSQKGFFVLVDCGAWLEQGNLDGKIVPNAQIGVLYDNDVRIYQFSPKSEPVDRPHTD
jgi:hypothetical protein